MDGVRKKAKYLHDAPDGALMPGVGGHYPHMNGNRPVPLPGQDQGAIAVGQQPGYYTQAPSATYYPPDSSQGPASAQDAVFSNSQTPISPSYTQTNHTTVQGIPTTVSQASSSQLQQFGGPLFDPSDPALFNFDISSLNFGNHYGALELGMLGHMSSGAVDTPANENPLNQAASMYNPQMSAGTYSEIPAHVSFGPDGLPNTEWQSTHSRHGSLQVQTPNNTPVTANLDHSSNRHDSLNGPHAYAIGQGPSSLSSASPASTDMTAGYDNDNPMSATTFFANAAQSRPQRSPTTGRLHPESRPGGPLQPVQSNVIRKRRQDSRSIYERVDKPYDYVGAFHRLMTLLQRKFSSHMLKRAMAALRKFRPVLLASASHLDGEDLLYTEKNLQRSLITMHMSFAEVGTPCLICRRSGEVVGMNKEFEILTGWKREVLLGHTPNLNVNHGPRHALSNDSGMSSQMNVTPTIPGQEPDHGRHSVNILELMDEPSAVQYLDDFADLAYEDPLGKGHRRVNMLRYLTQEDMARMADRANAANGKPVKHEPLVKHEDGSIHQGEAAMRNLGANGLIDAMIMWHIKRDNFDIPMLVSMQVRHTTFGLDRLLLTCFPDHAHAETVIRSFLYLSCGSVILMTFHYYPVSFLSQA